MKNKNLWTILDDLTEKDEIKFVIVNREDFDWAVDKINEFYGILAKSILEFFGFVDFQGLANLSHVAAWS